MIKNTGKHQISCLTGVKCLDCLLPEGHPIIGLHAILGCTGVGLTRIAAMICVNQAVQSINNRRKPVLWFGSQESQPQIREQMEKYIHSSSLSTESLTLMKFVDSTKKLHPVLNEVLSDINPSAIVIDDFEPMISYQMDNPYCGASVSRMMRSMLCQLSQIAQSMTIPIFVTHKLKGKHGTAHPNAIISHLEAASCKTFGRDLSTSFIVGNHSGNLFKVSCTKPVADLDTQYEIVKFANDGTTLAFATKDEARLFLEPTWVSPKVVVTNSLKSLIQQL